ncbi:TetR/AcrR family transcriptional regulator [Arthrobacter sp. MYb213]|uniref:TetR/AcrR family transcriptional regulator n=1 Tax=Arthrobacter sp. MYb213 TaxID=1848595 RepID=UPI000CFC76F1|nr:TetR/AcrR family transcriptional regulator [Arthrobacter sp. MYb213]PRB70405.1 hypothetical protein CQ011_09660 [Arthrobacter sp. MYb213]
MTGQSISPTSELPAYQVVRRQRIIDAAKDMLRVTDYESIQIRDVATSANVALGTLYRYFSSKDHLYAEVVFDWATPFSQTRLPNDELMGTTERISFRLRGALASFEKHPYFYKAILQLRSSSVADVGPVMVRLGEILEEPIRVEMSALDEAEAADITVMVWALLMDVVSRVISKDKTIQEAYRILDRFVVLVKHRLEPVAS